MRRANYVMSKFTSKINLVLQSVDQFHSICFWKFWRVRFQLGGFYKVDIQWRHTLVCSSSPYLVFLIAYPIFTVWLTQYNNDRYILYSILTPRQNILLTIKWIKFLITQQLFILSRLMDTFPKNYQKIPYRARISITVGQIARNT